MLQFYAIELIFARICALLTQIMQFLCRHKYLYRSEKWAGIYISELSICNKVYMLDTRVNRYREVSEALQVIQ